jgi:hypothetical protein
MKSREIDTLLFINERDNVREKEKSGEKYCSKGGHDSQGERTTFNAICTTS